MANRNRTEESKRLFARLEHRAAQEELPVAQGDGRWIQNPDKDDIRFLTRADVEAVTLTRQIRIARLTFEDQVLFALVGFDETIENNLPEGLRWSALTPASFALSVNELDLMPIASGAEIRQVIDHRHKGVGGFEGFDLEEIMPLFPKIIVVEAEQNYEYTLDPFRVAGALLAIGGLDGPIDFEADTRESFASLFTAGSTHIQYEDMVQGLLAVSWRGLFLELYRCIELLYGCVIVRNLDEDWPSRKHPWANIASILQEKLGWRPSEARALGHVMALAATDIVDKLAAELAVEIPEGGSKSDAVAKKIYDLRNSIVHSRLSFRKDHSVRKTDEEWNALVRLMIELIIDLYDKFGEEFFQATAASGPTNEAAMSA